MRFMVIRKADPDTEAGKLPSAELISAMMKYNEEMAKAGVFLDGTGLHPSAKGARVQTNAGKPVVTDGPFAETKELIAGFTMMRANSLEEAIEWVKRWPVEDGNIQLEIRQVFEMEDFASVITDEIREQDARVRALTGGKQES